MMATMSSDFCCTIPEREVRVWMVNTAAPAEMSAKYLEVLDAVELDRAAQFSRKRDHDSFVVTRGALRCLLGSCLDLHPAGIRFAYGAKGKPALAPANPLRFNVSHSEEFALIAVTPGCEIGIDIEMIRPVPEMEDIVKRYFHDQERTGILSQADQARERSFFRLWTRKEAYIKAIGESLSDLPLAIPVFSHPDLLVETVDFAPDGARSVWTFHDLELDPRFAAAIVYADRQRPLSVFPTMDPAELPGLSLAELPGRTDCKRGAGAD